MGNKRVRSWCFTLNNYVNADIALLTHEIFEYKTQKIVFQEEMGAEEKVPHLQGIIQFKEKMTLKNVKAILPKAHWEFCRSLHASIKYCSKKLTRSGNLYTYGAVSKWLEKEKKSLEVMIVKWKGKELRERESEWDTIHKSIQLEREKRSEKFYLDTLNKVHNRTGSLP